VLTAESSGLDSLIDRLVAAPFGAPGAAGAPGSSSPGPAPPSPVLVVHGADGSPRPDILVAAYERWAGRTPVALVDPRPFTGAGPVRALVGAIVAGLSDDVPGHRAASFGRVVLAQIAMAEPVDEPRAERAAAVMRARLDRYRDRTELRRLVTALLDTAGAAVHPEAAGVRPTSRVTADEIVRRLLGWWPRRWWRDPLAWFAHQDREPLLDPLSTLVQLSVHAQSPDRAVQAGVDDLLVAALLADLRAGRARAGGRPGNPLALIDHGDTPAAAAFLASLVRVRRHRATTARGLGVEVPGDPLVLAVTGPAALTAALAAEAPPPQGHERSYLADLAAVPGGRAWLAVAVDESGADDVTRQARERRWRPPLTPAVVAHSVHRLTSGNRLATALVLADLDQAPHHLEDFDALLRRRGPVGDRSLEEYLLDEIVGGLSPHGHLDPNLRDNLVTLAAARDDDEAGLLVGFLAMPITVNPLALASRAQRSSREGGRRAGRQAPLTRFLLLRALADRPDTHPASWHRAFTRLRGTAASRGDTGGRLHHDLALGALDAVVGELAGRLVETPARDWLALLDATVATPDPRRRDTTGPDAEVEADNAVECLVTSLHILADPSVSSPACLARLYRLAECAFRSIAERVAEWHRDDGDRAFLERAEHYRALAATVDCAAPTPPPGREPGPRRPAGRQ
jgi:hypothetical protein